MEENKALEVRDPEKFKKIFNDTENYKRIKDVSDYFGISERNIQKWRRKHQENGHKFATRLGNIGRPKELDSYTLKEKLQITRLESHINELKKQLRETERDAVSFEAIKELIHGIKDVSLDKAPPWINPKNKKIRTNGIPCLFLSDVHADEIVDSAQIQNVNEYNRQICYDSLDHTFKTMFDLLLHRFVNPVYDGIIIALGGDMLSGNIHDELRENNQHRVLKSLRDLAIFLASRIKLTADKFGRVFVPCVVGNHPRIDKKPRAKGAVQDNLEWLMYHYIADLLTDDKRITFFISDSLDAQFSVYGKTFLLTHGDQFRGGNGIAGFFSPLMMGMYKKQKRQSSINKNFDIMMVAHFHQYIHTNNLIVNGSVKGYDEFAFKMNFPYEPPQQALWINHPEKGAIFRTPVMCRASKSDTVGYAEKIAIIK